MALRLKLFTSLSYKCLYCGDSDINPAEWTENRVTTSSFYCRFNFLINIFIYIAFGALVLIIQMLPEFLVNLNCIILKCIK
ncbi:TPA: hypothetical protein L6B35_17960 [Pseudomonas aeruginosa]|nr:hypothetical protein [Pseudomonas aeruginosa]